MAPVPFQHPLRYTPLALAGAHLALIVYLAYAVGAGLYTSYKSLGPAQDTRSRQARRKRLAPVFLTLAGTAFLIATCSSIAYTRLSYITWAYEHGLDLPGQYDKFFYLVGEDGLISETRDSSQLYIAQWLSDTPIFEPLEIVAEKARRFWWGQQVDLATMAFSVLVAIEGRRRKIPMLPAFIALAHLVNLSFAQNLFYLALLLTPSPLPTGQTRPTGSGDWGLPVVPLAASEWVQHWDKLLPPKPKNWVPHPSIFGCALVLNLASISFIPYAAGTPSFTIVVLLLRLSTFLPLFLPKIVLVKWGKVHQHPHDAYDSFAKLFRFLSVAAFLLHAKATITGLISNTPDSHYHRHSVFFPWDVEERSKWERSTTAFGKLLGSIWDHPAVAAAGWDVLICTLSLGIWAAVRATDIQDIFRSTIPFYNHVASQAAALVPEKEQFPKPPFIKEEPELTDETEPEHHMTLRRRTRSGKNRGASIASSSGASEDVVLPPVRKRGRPKKTTKVEEEEKAYEPRSVEAEELVEGDILPQELDWDAATLAWGLAAFGGLASATAGVFGGECIAR
ncbi:hypothetical protein F4809DRAFT_648151 [Biscogniauxia mediterranea]|nr:hypothetical protein F4809DRAFT_648151 [Biscogniauxia mediterranea]